MNEAGSLDIPDCLEDVLKQSPSRIAGVLLTASIIYKMGNAVLFLTTPLIVHCALQGEGEHEVSLALSAILLGDVMTAYFWGTAGDIFGRKRVVIWAMLISIFGSLLTIFGDNSSTMTLARFLVGVGIGGRALPYQILAESLSEDRRSVLLLSTEFGWYVM
jgi:MFS family permease